MSEGNTNNTQVQQEAGQVSWGQVAKRGNKGGARSLWNQVDKLKLRDPNTQYRLRLIGDPYQYWKLYEPIEVKLDPEYNNELEVFKAGHKPSPRFAIWVIDRNDGDKIKLFEGGPMIFSQFGTYQDIIGDDPGGEDGPDWSVSFKDPVGDNGKPNPRLRQYRCMHVKPAPFTEEEKKRIAEHVAKFPYPEVIKGSDDDYINKLWEECKETPEGAHTPGSYLWYMDKKKNRDQQADQDLNLDTPASQQKSSTESAPANDGASDDAPAQQEAPAVDTSAESDGFEETFNTGAAAEEGAEQKSGGGTSLF